MGILAFIDKVAGCQQVRKQTCEQEFRSIVLALADDKEPNAERVEALLREMGKSVEDLRAAVELYEKRRDLRGLYDSRHEFTKERQSVERKISEADQAFAKAQEIHRQATTPLRIRLGVLIDDIGAAHDAERELHATCPDQSLCAQLGKASKRIGEINRERYEHQVQLKDCRGWLASDTEALKTVGTTHTEELKERIEHYNRVIAASEQALAKLNVEYESLRDEEREVQRHMLEP